MSWIIWDLAYLHFKFNILLELVENKSTERKLIIEKWEYSIFIWCNYLISNDFQHLLLIGSNFAYWRIRKLLELFIFRFLNITAFGLKYLMKLFSNPFALSNRLQARKYKILKMLQLKYQQLKQQQLKQQQLK